MMKRVIAFEDFLAPHSGSALAKTLRNVFLNFNLKNKIMSITLDNASNNTSVIGKLKLKYKPPMKDFEEEILDAEVQANEAIPLSNEEIALDAASSEGSTSGPGSGGEEAKAEVWRVMNERGRFSIWSDDGFVSSFSINGKFHFCRSFSPSSCLASRRSCSGGGVSIYYVSLLIRARGAHGELELLKGNRLKDLEKMSLLITLVDRSHEALAVKVDHLPDVDG
nr:zinc finger BED domain-containing protein RICESLEEPER 2-like [Tanacetum cinerariifolium]